MADSGSEHGPAGARTSGVALNVTRTITAGRDPQAGDALLTREWLVTNGLGGYASGTVIGAATRRYHGLLIAALPNPLGRMMMLSQLWEQIRLPGARVERLAALSRSDRLELFGLRHLREFRLEQGLPRWRFELEGFAIEKAIYFSYLQNTVFITYRMVEGSGSLRLSLRPGIHFRSHDAQVSSNAAARYRVHVIDDRFEIASESGSCPPLRLRLRGEHPTFVCEAGRETSLNYSVEADRGYDALGELWSPGHFKVVLSQDHPVALVASTESWETLDALGPEQALSYELDRRARLVAMAGARSQTEAELAIAADQFVIVPVGRVADAARARARGEELRTVIAGYHWFTDWGRDTMISLEGLTLATGRHAEARSILSVFAHYVEDGLIPNMFPEGSQRGLYHTADATLWFFHAVDRYLAYTGDRTTLRELLPVLDRIVKHHVQGTRFGIHVDERDGLLVQGEPGYQLTWMDAKCDGWVVTPRRGKAVEINALWYNALCVLARWLGEEHGEQAAAPLRAQAERTHASFNARFWYDDGGYLYDVVDSESGGDDAAFRPNQLFAIALPNPVLDEARWPSLVDAAAQRLLTPVGLRSLDPGHPDYKPTYHGDLRTRDAAYHQGTVWSWLIGPFIDAFLKVHPERRAQARSWLGGLVAHLDDAGIGTISEVFDAEAPFTARGCMAQAWGVAELLRAWRMTAE
jgi:predicted glycogen debranching enzyme